MTYQVSKNIPLSIDENLVKHPYSHALTVSMLTPLVNILSSESFFYWTFSPPLTLMKRDPLMCASQSIAPLVNLLQLILVGRGDNP